MNPTQAGYLIELFNHHHDFARKMPDGGFAPALKKHATHQLVCTKWNPNVPKNDKQSIRMRKTRPAGYALSVCAVPMRKKPLDRVPTAKEKLENRFLTPIWEDAMPVFCRAGTLAGKRRVLCSMAAHHATPTKMRRHIKSLASALCDRLYRSMCRANRRARRKALKLARRKSK